MTSEVVFQSAARILFALPAKHSGTRIVPLRNAFRDPMPVDGLTSGASEKAQTRKSARA